MIKFINKIEIKRICVYCGSSTGKNPIYTMVASQLGNAIAAAGLGLVYGGGSSGLMGTVARAVINRGGYVTGIIPTSLVNVENALYDINEYIEVSNFHERKMQMFKLSDAFIALPGGPGTLEEIAEQLAWSYLGIHEKPIFIVNTNGYWNPLIDLLKKTQTYFCHNRNNKANYIIVKDPEEAINIFSSNN
ncbi:LOG family protein [Xanthocytophaga flava]|uniref:LOG family protein n=1 Tax=Xanthocytophaga flava TaxID=3048013 RepID=UPI0028D6E997|nr:TIGR00730 family Rossman fold protein [Xanthocytophaga flavus]MDJ1473225.1 TIGR00730 family Rossman fold protein [Xanthocytophaga flavus]